MLIDLIGTELRHNRIILSPEWRIDRTRPLQWWMPQGNRTHYKACVYSFSGLMLWQTPFETLIEALQFQWAFRNGDRPLGCPGFDIGVQCVVENVAQFTSVGTQVWHVPDGITPINRQIIAFPPGDPQHDPEAWQALVASYTTSNSTASDWPTGNIVPSGVTATDYLVVAGGGGGHRAGGGAGGMRTATAFAVTPGAAATITVGAAGPKNSATLGGVSTFSSITSNGGGPGRDAYTSGTVGSGGGGAFSNSSGVAGTAGQGNAGGNGTGASFGYGGGGGKGAAGTAASGSNGGAGGAGEASSITGSSVTYAAGGGGGGSSSGGAGGTGGGGDGKVSGASGAGATNKGCGGGGNYSTTADAGDGGSGIIVLSYTAGGASGVTTNLAMMGM